VCVEMKQIFIETGYDGLKTFRIEQDTTVGSLKRLLQNSNYNYPKEMYLTYGGRVLQGEMTFQGIPNEATLRLDARLIGGGASESLIKDAEGKDEQDHINRRLLRQYRQLMEINGELEKMQDDGQKETIPITCMILLGLQSAGKTSVLNVLIKCYAGFCAAGTATRCLVKYYLRHAPGIKRTRYMVDGVETDDLGEKLNEVSEHIKDTSPTGFSNKPCEVVIEGENVLDLVFIDTPGLCPQNTKKNDIIKDIIRPVITKEENVFVIVSKAVADIGETDQTRNILDSLFKSVKEPTWFKRSLFLMSGIDLRLPHMSKEGLIDYRRTCQRYFLNPKDFLMISCNPENKNFNDCSSWDETNRYIETIPTLEHEMWEEYFSEKKVPITERKYTGIDKLEKAFARCVVQTMKTNAHVVIPKMKAIERALAQDYDAAVDVLRSSDPEKLRQVLDDFRADFKDTISGYNEARSSQDEELSAENSGLSWTEQWNAMESSRMWEDRKKWRHLLEPEELMEALKANHQYDLLDILSIKMKGQSAIKRTIDVFGFLIVAAPMKRFSVSKIYDAARPEITSNWNFHSAVQNLLADSLSHVKDGQIWLGDTMEFIYYHSADIVYEHLSAQKRYRHLAEEPLCKLTDKISRSLYKRIVSRIMKEFKSKSEQNFRNRCAVLNVQHADNLRRTAESFWGTGVTQPNEQKDKDGSFWGTRATHPNGQKDTDSDVNSTLQSSLKSISQALTIIEKLGFFENVQQISTQFLSMLPVASRKNLYPTTNNGFIVSVLTATFENYRCYIFALKEEITAMAYREMNRLSTRSDTDIISRGIRGYALDHHTIQAFRVLSETYQINQRELIANIENLAKKRGELQSLRELDLGTIAELAGLGLQEKRNRVAATKAKVDKFAVIMKNNKKIFDEFRASTLRFRE